jgi:hypothetical protein
MDGRGRKSASALAVVSAIPGQRPEPPEALSEAEADIWRRVAATKPHDWFTPDTYPLLAEYCRATVAANQIASELSKIKVVPKNGDKFRRWLALRDRQDKTARLLATLATKMRLSQQSRYTEKTADTAARRIAGSRPWEFDKTAG